MRHRKGKRIVRTVLEVSSKSSNSNDGKVKIAVYEKVRKNNTASSKKF